MGKNILFISDISNSFFLNTIITNLEKNGFTTELVDYDAQRIATAKMDVGAYFMFLGAGALIRCYDGITWVKNTCRERGIKTFILGDKKEIDEVTEYLEEGIIRAKFVRPANASDIANLILKSFEDEIKTDTRKNILLVDDSGTVLHTMKQWLEPTYKVQMVNSASTALVCLAKFIPDLILLDYEMPVCDGPQMLSMLRADPKFSSIPVMFLTGRGDRESIQAVLSLQPQGYLLKTQPKEKILEALAEYFQRGY